MSREAFEAWAKIDDKFTVYRSTILGRDYVSDLTNAAWRAWQAAQDDAFERLGIALRIKTEEHQCCTEDLLALRKNEQDGWKEAAIAWEVCASIHNKWAKGKDALYSTRHADFVKHADDARQKLTL